MSQPCEKYWGYIYQLTSRETLWRGQLFRRKTVVFAGKDVHLSRRRTTLSLNPYLWTVGPE